MLSREEYTAYVGGLPRGPYLRSVDIILANSLTLNAVARYEYGYITKKRISRRSDIAYVFRVKQNVAREPVDLTNSRDG
jgi:hypothetical protein